MSSGKLFPFIGGQFLGAFLAGLTVYFLFGSSIKVFEDSHQIVRGSLESIQTAKMFGEFYSTPGVSLGVGLPLAIAAETFGTFLLLLMIFALTEGCNVGRPDNALAPLFIGLTVTSIICLIAPLTQAGLNPARDFGPRMVAWIFGWGAAAFPDRSGGFFLVYMLGPVVGGLGASLFFVKVLEPAMNHKSRPGECDCEKK
jgi:glycerol uptake facilitator protein